jgi:anti-anti-sigma factor
MEITERNLTLDKFTEEQFVPFSEHPFWVVPLQESDFTERGINHCVVLDIGGRLVGPECQELVEHIKRLIEKGERIIVINLKAVISVDEWGVGSLVSCYVSIKNSGGAWLLANPSRKFQNRIKIMGIL